MAHFQEEFPMLIISPEFSGINLDSQGINQEQAKVLRISLTRFSDGWGRPKMSIHDDYDSIKVNCCKR